MSVIRAKFRVLQHHRYMTNGASFEAQPVHVKHRPDDHEGSEENALFYKSTPGGVLKMSTTPEALDTTFKLGQALYIDFQPDPKGDWQISDCELRSNGRLSFRLNKIGEYGSTVFSADIDNWEAVALLLPHVLANQETLIAWRRENPTADLWRTPDIIQRWSVVISPAPG